MNDYESMDYLQELLSENGKSVTLDFLTNISYMLADNGYADARTFIDNLYDMTDDGEI